MIHVGDCVEVMAGMEPDSIDAICTDPPYGLGFMGKDWDDAARMASRPPSAETWNGGKDKYPRTGKGPAAVAFDGRAYQSWTHRWATEALRVAKPGAYLLAFGGTRTVHRLTVALEDAGWIIRDLIVWAYAQGFPKSRSSLKPAWEPIVLARKPGPLRELGIDACRIEADYLNEPGRGPGWLGSGHQVKVDDGWQGPAQKREGSTVADRVNMAGRWPANVILTAANHEFVGRSDRWCEVCDKPDRHPIHGDKPVAIFDGGWEGVVGGGMAAGAVSNGRTTQADWGMGPQPQTPGYGDTGTYSRFFLIPKASRSDREPKVPGAPATLDGGVWGGAEDDLTPGKKRVIPRVNGHPTVKSTDLMRHLVRLVTPPGGTVLDCFAGSGSTLLAAEMEGFAWVGIEREPEYVAIAEQRLVEVQRGLGLSA